MARRYSSVSRVLNGAKAVEIRRTGFADASGTSAGRRRGFGQADCRQQRQPGDQAANVGRRGGGGRWFHRYISGVRAER